MTQWLRNLWLKYRLWRLEGMISDSRRHYSEISAAIDEHNRLYCQLHYSVDAK